MFSFGNFSRRHETSDRSPSGGENPPRSGHRDIDAVVFSGGGARCFWQAGFWQAVQGVLPRPAVVAAVSGGAALGQGLGFHTSTVRARDCSTPEELVHAIFQSSAAPPVFPVTLRNGHPALDGGLVEYVPLSTVVECRRPLVLLSRHLRDLPRGGRELYACPSRPVPVSTWDFSSPDKVIDTFELGRGDGARFLGGQQARAPAR